MNKEELILKLFTINAVKFGEFTLKSGMKSPIYIDLRMTVSYPEVLEQIADLMIEQSKNLKFDLLTGIPYTALPIATIMSLKLKKPLIFKRKEVKDYGTRKMIEGIWQRGQTCLVVDDLITTGASKLETIEPFEKEGLIVKDIVVLVDREQGGKEQLEQKNYSLHAILKISEILDILLKYKKIDESKFNEVKSYFQKQKN